ncbi:MAG: metallophosphoesterase family protein [Acutalibacteraceae bacterium]
MKRTRTFAIGDIHGCFNELLMMMTAIKERGGYDPEKDRLIFLGDYIDRGEDSKSVVGYIRYLQEKYDNVIALMGNHEKMCVDYLEGTDRAWLWNGCKSTIESYGGTENIKSDAEWMKSLPLYYEDDDFVFVHAGIDPEKPLEKHSENELLWVRDEFINSTKKFPKKVIFGHTPSLMITNQCEPYVTPAGNIGIDTGLVYGGGLTALIITEAGEISFC